MTHAYSLYKIFIKKIKKNKKQKPNWHELDLNDKT